MPEFQVRTQRPYGIHALLPLVPHEGPPTLENSGEQRYLWPLRMGSCSRFLDPLSMVCERSLTSIRRSFFAFQANPTRISASYTWVGDYTWLRQNSSMTPRIVTCESSISKTSSSTRLDETVWISRTPTSVALTSRTSTRES